ncbi:MAG: proprotein convertase P-domain-containing protein [Deinococcus sp.]|nr:proprotein convertase P-domain-containing protein [Deinococcus sp.]
MDPSVITVPAAACPAGQQGLVEDLNVTLDISHTFDGDLDVILTAPNTASVSLFTSVGNSAAGFQVTLDDEATFPISHLQPDGCGGLPGPSSCEGTFQPEPPFVLSTFDGINPEGDWTLRVEDGAISDIGILNDWSLIITCIVPPAVPALDGVGVGFLVLLLIAAVIRTWTKIPLQKRRFGA